MLYIVLSLLYLGQLIYVTLRWGFVTSQLLEQARMARLRRAVDWTQAPQPAQARRLLKR